MSLSLCLNKKEMNMGRLKKTMKKDGKYTKNVVDVEAIAGTLSDKEKEKLLFGDGFVKVPSEELLRIRVSSYSYLL